MCGLTATRDWDWDLNGLILHVENKSLETTLWFKWKQNNSLPITAKQNEGE